MEQKSSSFGKHPVLARVLIGLLLMSTVFAIASTVDMTSTTSRLSTTVEYLKDQCNNSVLRDMASEAKSLLRISESVDSVRWRLRYEGTKVESDDDTVLRECAADSYLAGVFLLDVDGNVTAQYNSGDLTAETILANLDTAALMDIIDFPEKNYTMRYYIGDSAHVDIAAVGRLDEPGIVVGYFYTDEEYANTFNNSIRSVVDGYSIEQIGTVVISDGSRIVASNNEALIGEETTSVPVLKKIMEQGITKKLIHCYNPDWPISNHFGLMERSRNYYIYVYLNERDVFHTATQNLLFAGFLYLMVLVALQMSQSRAEKNYQRQQIQAQKEYAETLEQKNRELEALLEKEKTFNTKLYHDALTGAYNRRYYDEVVCSSIGPAGVAVMDLDDFKICNDTYGHHAGDMALETAAEAIRACIRKNDLLIRYGGDEFVLILTGIPSDSLKPKLEKIRARVQDTPVPGYPHLRLSLSIGGTMQSLTDSMETAMRCADRLMYQAKQHKNAVVADTAGSSLSVPEQKVQTKPQILVVDDAELNRMILAEILGRDYRVLEAANGQDCLDKMKEYAGDIALVLLDINMPVMDGFEVLKAMNANHSIEDVPVIMISSEDSDEAIRKAYELGASDFVNRPFDARVVYRRASNTIKLYAKQRRLVQMVSDQIRAREQNTTMLVGVLSQIVEFRNGESGTHVRHIRVLTEMLLERLVETTDRYRINSDEQDDIPLASALHDIGKIAIDEKILNKPGRLTKEEFEIVKTHTTHGAEMLSRLENFEEESLLHTAYEIARWHHERWDGRGYPDGLKGDEIPISAQLVSVADAYDALTSERCYKKAFSHEKSIQMILNGECGAFNPLLLKCLTDIQDELKAELQNGFR